MKHRLAVKAVEGYAACEAQAIVCARLLMVARNGDAVNAALADALGEMEFIKLAEMFEGENDEKKAQAVGAFMVLAGRKGGVLL